VDVVSPKLVEQPAVVGYGEHAEADLVGRRLHPAGAGPQGVDVETRVELVQHGDGRTEDAELQGLVLLLLAARQVDVEGPIDEPGIERQALGLGPDVGVDRDGVATAGAGRRLQQRVERHAGHLGRVLQGEEQSGLGPLPRFEPQHVDAVERHGPSQHLVAGAAHQDVGQRRLARPVGTHHRVHLARPHSQVDAAQDLLARHPGAQPGDLEHVTDAGLTGRRAHSSITTTMSPSSTRTS
jgi:hypothetical protein